jgi:hypothetical protein
MLARGDLAGRTGHFNVARALFYLCRCVMCIRIVGYARSLRVLCAAGLILIFLNFEGWWDTV